MIQRSSGTTESSYLRGITANNTKSHVLVNGILTEEFNFGCGVRQGSIGSPVLFTHCVDANMITALNQHSGDITISSGVVLNNLDFAGDIELHDKDSATLQVHIHKI